MGGLGNVHIIGHAAPRRVVTGLRLARFERICAIGWERTCARVVHYPIGDAKRNDKYTGAGKSIPRPWKVSWSRYELPSLPLPARRQRKRRRVHARARSAPRVLL